MNKELKFVPGISVYLIVVIESIMLAYFLYMFASEIIYLNFYYISLYLFCIPITWYMLKDHTTLLTSVCLTREGCTIKRGWKQKFYLWSEFETICHCKTTKDKKDLIVFSINKIQPKRITYSISYMMFKNKFEIVCIEFPSKEEIERARGKIAAIWFEREEFLTTMGSFGVKIQSELEDFSSYYAKAEVDRDIELKDGLYIKKVNTNMWRVITEKAEHFIKYDANEKSLYIDNIKRDINNDSIVKFIGIDKKVYFDEKKLNLIIKKNVLRIAYKGKYIDLDEPYIPLKAERIIYCPIPFPIIFASIGALKGIKEMFLISFVLLFVLYVYIAKEMKTNSK